MSKRYFKRKSEKIMVLFSKETNANNSRCVKRSGHLFQGRFQSVVVDPQGGAGTESVCAFEFVSGSDRRKAS
jgi:uncharacterized Fe-S cluster protein YjdI